MLNINKALNWLNKSYYIRVAETTLYIFIKIN
nr:MAG TPA: hypothetical protein [Caudoviricetes sp.]